MVWTSEMPGEEEHPGVTMAASAVLIVVGVFALWGAWKMGVFAWAVEEAHTASRPSRVRRDGSFVWWGIVVGLGFVGAVLTVGGVAWFYKGGIAAIKGERVR